MSELNDIQLPKEISDKIAAKSEKVAAVAGSLFYQFDKHKLSNLDCIIVLSSVFNCIKEMQPTEDAKTDLEVMFNSMIEVRPETTEKK